MQIAASDIKEVISYWDRRPCNIRHSKKEVGSREYFDEVEKRKYFVEPHIPSFADFPKWRGKKVLEIGCGIGTDAINFARSGADYTGLELSQESLNLTKQRFDVFGLSGNFFQGNAENADKIIKQHDFDLVYSFGVIHHTPNPAHIIKAAHNLLKPNGEIRFMVYSKNSYKSAMIRAGLDQPEAQSGCPIAFEYSADEIRELVGEDFEIQEISFDHIFPYVIEKYINHEYELQPWFRAMPKSIFSALERNFGWHALVKAIAIK